MPHITLTHSTGQTSIDLALYRLIEEYETAFPGRIAGYYLLGSYADASEVSTSYVDLDIIFKERFHDENEKKAAWQLSEELHRQQIEMDVSITEEATLRSEGVTPTLKLGSRLLYGEDVCARYSLVSIEEWTHERMHAVYYLLLNIYQRQARMNLDYPDSHDEFFGYMNRQVSTSNGQAAPSTRNLVRTTGWAATALLALRARQYIARKRDCHLLYRQCIADEWGPFLEDIYISCRSRWHYLLPQNSKERRRLRELCEQTLAFERYFLQGYKAFLLTQLREGPSEYRQRALALQKHFPLDDAEIKEALRAWSR